MKKSPKEVLLLSGCLFGVLAAYYLMKPVRDALLIHRAGLESLPYALLLQSIAAFFTVFLLNFAASRFQRRSFVAFTTLSFVIVGFCLLILMGWSDPTAAKIVAIFFYVWSTVYIVAALSTIWSLAASRYSFDDGRRYYLLIALASPVGALVGAWISGSIVPRFGLSGSMTIAVVVLAAVCGLATSLAPKFGEPFDFQASVWVAGTRGLLNSLREPILARIALLVVCSSCVWAILDRQVYFVIGKQKLTEEAVGTFFGYAYTQINWLTLAAQVALLWWIRRGFNPLNGITLLPLICLIGAVLGSIILIPSIWFFVWGGYAIIAYSINYTSREMLYLHVSEDNKYRSKAVIDILILRASEGVGGILLYIVYQSEQTWRISLLLGTLGLVWLFVARSIRQLILHKESI